MEPLAGGGGRSRQTKKVLNASFRNWLERRRHSRFPSPAKKSLSEGEDTPGWFEILMGIAATAGKNAAAAARHHGHPLSMLKEDKVVLAFNEDDKVLDEGDEQVIAGIAELPQPLYRKYDKLLPLTRCRK